MSSTPKANRLRQIAFGDKVDRSSAALPQTATGNIFTISGGRILVTSLIGMVTVATNATATTLSIGTVPTTGTASTVGLASATAVTSREIGTLVSLNATAGGALVVAADAGRAAQAEVAFVVPVGSISITTSASNATGAMSWSLTWMPYDVGASVVAA